MKPPRGQRDTSIDLAISHMDYELPANATIAQHRTWRRQELFLASYSVLGSIAAACAETSIPVATVESWDHKDAHGFKKRKQDAGTVALSLIEAEIDRRGRVGVDRPIIYKGKITGHFKDYSDNLLMFRAKRLDPVYRDNYQAPASLPNDVTQININLHPGVRPPTREETMERGGAG